MKQALILCISPYTNRIILLVTDSLETGPFKGHIRGFGGMGVGSPQQNTLLVSKQE